MAITCSMVQYQLKFLKYQSVLLNKHWTLAKFMVHKLINVIEIFPKLINVMYHCIA